MSRQGCESQWKGHFKVNRAMKTPAKETYVSYNITTSQVPTWHKPGCHTGTFLPDLLWCSGALVTLHSWYSRYWETEVGIFFPFWAAYLLFNEKIHYSEKAPDCSGNFTRCTACRRFLHCVSTFYLILNLVNMYLPLITWIWVITLSSICFSVS